MAAQKHLRNRLIAIIFLIVFLIFIVLEWLAPHFLTTLFTGIAKPFWRAQFNIESGALKSEAQLLAENESLKMVLSNFEIGSGNAKPESIPGYSPEAVTSTSSIGYQQFLRMIQRRDLPEKIAPVLARPPATYYDELVIDAGLEQGLEVGDVVYSSSHMPIGSIADALKQTSKVILFTSPGQSHQALLRPSDTPITIAGNGGGQYSAEVSRDIKVNEGDVVISSLLGDEPIGVVDAVINDSAQPFQKIIIAPTMNIYNLRWVIVGKNKMTTE